MRRERHTEGVRGSQNISAMCLVCGDNNDLGLKAQFLDLDDGSVVALFTTLPQHQGYPGRVHGGIISAVIDEAIGRAVQTLYPEVFGVTIELNVKFRRPVPLSEPLKVVARLDSHSKRIYEGTAELLLADGTVAAQGHARYIRLDVEEITAEGLGEDVWHDDLRDIPATIDI